MKTRRLSALKLHCSLASSLRSKTIKRPLPWDEHRVATSPMLVTQYVLRKTREDDYLTERLLPSCLAEVLSAFNHFTLPVSR